MNELDYIALFGDISVKPDHRFKLRLFHPLGLHTFLSEGARAPVLLFPYAQLVGSWLVPTPG